MHYTPDKKISGGLYVSDYMNIYSLIAKSHSILPKDLSISFLSFIDGLQTLDRFQGRSENERNILESVS